MMAFFDVSKYFFGKVILLRFKEFHGLHDDLKIIWETTNPCRYRARTKTNDVIIFGRFFLVFISFCQKILYLGSLSAGFMSRISSLLGDVSVEMISYVALYNYYHIYELKSSSNWVWLSAALGYDFGWYWTHS